MQQRWQRGYWQTYNRGVSVAAVTADIKKSEQYNFIHKDMKESSLQSRSKTWKDVENPSTELALLDDSPEASILSKNATSSQWRGSPFWQGLSLGVFLFFWVANSELLQAISSGSIHTLIDSSNHNTKEPYNQPAFITWFSYNFMMLSIPLFVLPQFFYDNASLEEDPREKQQTRRQQLYHYVQVRWPGAGGLGMAPGPLGMLGHCWHLATLEHSHDCRPRVHFGGSIQCGLSIAGGLLCGLVGPPIEGSLHPFASHGDWHLVCGSLFHCSATLDGRREPSRDVKCHSHLSLSPSTTDVGSCRNGRIGCHWRNLFGLVARL